MHFSSPFLKKKKKGEHHIGINDDDSPDEIRYVNSSPEVSLTSPLEIPSSREPTTEQQASDTTHTNPKTPSGTPKDSLGPEEIQNRIREKKKKKGTQEGGWRIWDVLWGSKKGQNRKLASSDPGKVLNRHHTTISKLGGSSTWVSAVLLSLWDNIFGPRVQQAWNGIECLPSDVMSSLGRHALSGELGDKELQLESDPESKLHVFPSHVVIAVLFTAPLNPPTLTRLGLLLVVKKEYLQRLLIIHSTILSEMYRLVYKLRALMLRPTKGSISTSVEMFSPLLHPFVTHLEAIFYSSLASQNFPTSLFCTPQLTINHDFLTRAITSHLQTHGCTVVIGPNVDVVNMLIDTLSLFLSSKEKEQSSQAYEGRVYVPGLILQGLVGATVTEEEIIQSLLPTTIVDLEKQTVTQTQVYHEYVRVRQHHMNREIERLINDELGENAEPEPQVESQNATRGAELTKTSSKDNVNSVPASLIRPLREASPYIGLMIKEAFRYGPAMREAFITQSLHLLTRKAVLLIKYVEAERKMVKVSMLPVEVVKHIRTVLELMADADFLVVLGIAEKLSPGVYQSLDVDPLVMEEKIVELFDQWALG